MASLNRSKQVETPAGTPFGGSVDLVVNEDGTYKVTFTMHSSSNFGSFDFRVLATLSAPGAPAWVFVHGGHVSGVNSDIHVENGHDDRLALYLPTLMAAADPLQVAKDYRWGGVVGTFNDLVKDVVTLGGGAVGATLGMVIGATREATGWIGLDLGPGGTLGVIAGVAIFQVGLVEGLGSGGSFIVGTVGGATTSAIANELIEHRPLSDPEKALARRVFADTIDLDRVRVTNFQGVGGRAFTAPGVDGLIYCNLAEGFNNPATYTDGTYPTPGQLLVHELAHAWQICHSSSWPAMMCSGVMNQTQHMFGDNVYAYGPAGPDWRQLNAEQQGAIVDQWYGGSRENDAQNRGGFRPMSRCNPYYRYVVDDVRGGRPVPDVSVAAVHPRTDEGAVSLFTVGGDGHVWGNFWPAAGGGDWAGWFQVGHDTFPAGAPVAALHSRTDEGAVTLFVTDAVGNVWTNYWPAANTEAGLASGHIGQWFGWQSLGGNRHLPAAAPVTAIRPRSQEGATSLFGVGHDGRVWSSYWPADNIEADLAGAGLAGGQIGQRSDWSDWFALGDNTFPAGAPVTAVHARTDEGSVSLFVVGFDGKVWSSYWPAAGKPATSGHLHALPGAEVPPMWSAWFPIGDHAFRLGGTVTALHARSGEGAVSLYAVEADPAARVLSTAWPSAAGAVTWSSWREVAADMFPAGAPVTALHPRTQDGATSLYAVRADGRVWTTFWPVPAGDDAGHWSGWGPVGDARFPAWATVSAVHTRTDEGATSLFVIGDDRRVWTTYWPVAADNPVWAPWYALGDKELPI